MRKLLWLALLIVGLLQLRRRREAGRERVHLHFDDGSFVTFVGRSPEAAALVPLAHRVLAAVRAA